MRCPPLLVLLTLLLGCAPKAKLPCPLPSVGPWSVDRAALPGGTLRILKVATTSSPARYVIQGEGGGRMELPIWVYVFEHPSEGTVLIDAAFPRRTAVDPNDYPGRSMTKLLGLKMEPGAAAADRLPEAGLDPAAVRHIVLTHMHPDHVGGIEDFPGATVHVGPGEWDFGFRRSPLGKPDTSPYAGREGVDSTVFEGSGAYGPFVGHRDLFGDGSLILLETPGHTPGHMSVLVNLPSGSYLFTGDCAWVDRHWQEPVPKGGLVRALLEDDWRLNWQNQWRLHEFAAAHPDVLVFAGHEPTNGDKLPPWPQAIP